MKTKHPNRFRQETAANAHGKAYEVRAAAKLGARLTPNSGATQGAKGDMQRGTWLLESKTTVHASLSLEFGWLVKITEEARAKAKIPGLVVGFVLPGGRPRPNAESEWVMMPMQVYQELVDGR